MIKLLADWLNYWLIDLIIDLNQVAGRRFNDSRFTSILVLLFIDTVYGCLILIRIGKIVSMSQNVLRFDMKKSWICPNFGLIWAPILSNSYRLGEMRCAVGKPVVGSGMLGLAHLGPIWPTLEPNLPSLEWVCLWVRRRSSVGVSIWDQTGSDWH